MATDSTEKENQVRHSIVLRSHLAPDEEMEAILSPNGTWDRLVWLGNVELAQYLASASISRVLAPSVRCVAIGRYSVLPYYDEVSQQVRQAGAELVNSPAQHRWIADMEYTLDLAGLTPKTYLPAHNQAVWYGLPEGQYVVKGLTNSKKFKWNTHMYAPCARAVPHVVDRLMDDTFLAEQGIVVRKYVPLKRLAEGINGLPIVNEYRFFVLYGKIIASGFYWANEPDLAQPVPAAATRFVKKVIEKVGDNANFYVVDVAEKEAGGWIVVELNDGQMSGLSTIDAREFYLAMGCRLDEYEAEYEENP